MADRREKPLAPHERRVLQLALLAGLPGIVVSLALLWRDNYSAKVQWTLGLVVLGSWLITALVLRERVVRPLQTLSNMLAALREGDYSIRARGAEREDALGLAYLEANLLGETLRTQRLGAMEATALLRTVMADIDVAVFAFDDDERLRLVNSAGERLLGHVAERLLGRTAEQVGLEPALPFRRTFGLESIVAGAAERDAALLCIVQLHRNRVEEALRLTEAGRWEVRRGSFRQNGRPHTLLVLADVTKALREEELQAWRRLVRVLSHEINNSLAPIKSIAGSLQTLLDRPTRAGDVDDDIRRGLAVIGGRSEALIRFMSAYARLARLPAPQRVPLDVGTWVRRVAALETRLPVRVEGGPQTIIRADGDQLDQLLINLLRNAVDASLETGGDVCIRWTRQNGTISIMIEDEGPGLPSSANLFVPFFTTKPQGSGIGLVLSRQIAEAHGGALLLENRKSAPGCIATFRLSMDEAVRGTG